ncbi:MAG: PASTA domain-containing protein [Bacilli bacterium]|nr:PASTA domain-containing protein [Bacilli bacterium]
MDEKEKIENEKKKKELMKVLYEEEQEQEKIITKKKKPIFTNIILSLLFVCSLTFSAFLIIDSSNKIDELYEIINSILVFIITLTLIISFPKIFYKRKTGAIIFTSLLIIIAMVFNILYLFKIIKLPTQNYIKDYTNKELTQALTWTEKNNIDHEETFEYSDTIKKYNIISQDIKPKTLTKNIKNINFSVSNGPDYNKELIMPDMTDYKTDEVLKFIDKNLLKNVDIQFEENEEIENDKIIKQSTVGNIKRNDKIIFTASLGKKENLKPIKLKDLKNKKLLYATTYLGKNGIPYELKFEYSNKIQRGNIIKTDKQINQELKQTDKIILTVSKGKKIIIPDLKNKSLKEVTKWIIENNLEIEYLDKYDSSIKKGKAIEANYKKGDIIEEEAKITVTFSKGPLKMPKFDKIDSFKQWAEKYQIKYEIKEEFSNDIPKDNIIKYSVKEGEKLNPEDTITVYISKGKAIKTPNFIGMTKEEANKECNSLNIICSFYNTLSDKKEGTVISQSIEKDTEIVENQNIDIEIATKKQAEVTKKKETTNPKTNTNTQTNTNNSNNNTNNQNTQPQTNQCEGKGPYTVSGLNNEFNNCSSYDTCAKQIKQYLENKYNGVTINIIADETSDLSSGSYISGIGNGSKVECGKTYTIKLAK